MPPDANPETRYRSSADDRRDRTVGHSRRSFLAGTGAAVTSLATTAGCVEVLPALGQAARYESVDMPPADPPRYRKWAPASGDYLGIGFRAIARPSGDAESVLGFPFKPGADWIAPEIDYFGVGIEHYDLAFSLVGASNDVSVLEGPVAPPEVAETILGSGYEADGTLAEYDRYVREDVPRTVTVTDGRILFGKGPERDAAIEHALDTYEGRVPRLLEQPAFERVTDEVGLRPLVWTGERYDHFLDDHEIDRYSLCLDYDERGIVYGWYAVFDGSAPSREAFREGISDHDISDSVDTVEIRRDGSFGGFEARFTNDGTAHEFWGSDRTTVQITWGVERSSDAYVLRHEAGDVVPAADLVVSVGYRDSDPVPADVQFTDQYETVGPGTTLRVPTDAIPDSSSGFSVWYVTEEAQMTLFDVDP